MNLWIVRVDCLRLNGNNQKVYKKSLLVEANGSEGAKVSALAYFETHTDTFGDPWIDMEWRSTSPVKLPMEVTP